MNTLKKQNGRYYQECNVVMLATENKEYDYKQLIIFKNELQLSNWSDKKGELGNVIKGQHLYITSNEEIKENDWYYSIKYGILKARVTTPNIDYEKEGCKKIIATTDETLYLTFNNGKTDLKFVLPKPSNSFISKYIEEYNKGNQIIKVLVEYEPYHYSKEFIDIRYRLKVDSNNTITIKKVKDSYSKEEVVKLLKEAMNEADSHGRRIQAYYMSGIGGAPLTPESFCLNWIKENL